MMMMMIMDDGDDVWLTAVNGWTFTTHHLSWSIPSIYLYHHYHHSTTGNDDPLVLVAVAQLFARGGRAVKARRRYKSSSTL